MRTALIIPNQSIKLRFMLNQVKGNKFLIGQHLTIKKIEFREHMTYSMGDYTKINYKGKTNSNTIEN